jgi:hypothetical protein
MLLARALLLLLAFVLLSPSAWAQETRDIQILVDGAPRRALLVNNFGPGQAVPVISCLATPRSRRRCGIWAWISTMP